jgi:hypothetical protein
MGMAARLAAIAVAAPMAAKVVPGVVELRAAPGTGEPRGTAVAAITCFMRSFCWRLRADTLNCVVARVRLGHLVGSGVGG